MSLDTALEEAASRLREEPVAPPAPFGEVRTHRRAQRRRHRLTMTAAAVVLVLIGAAAVIRTGTEAGLQVVTDEVTDPSTGPAVPVLAGAGLDVVGGGEFRLISTGMLQGIEEQVGDPVDTDVLDHRLPKDSDLTAEAAGNRYRVESFDADVTTTGPWLRGELGERPTLAIGPRRLAAVERTDTSASLTWAYDDHRVVRVSMVRSDGAAPSDEQLLRLAGAVLAADRLPRPDVAPPTGAPANVAGLSYLEAEQVLLDQGYTVRVSTQIVAGAPDHPSPVLAVEALESDPTILVVTTRISPTGIAELIDPDGLPVVAGADEFVPASGQDGLTRFFRGSDHQPFPIGGDEDDPGGSAFPKVSMLPGGELAGIVDFGFVPLDVLIDPTADDTEVHPWQQDEPLPATSEERDGEPVDRPPYDPKPGWVTVEQNGLQISVPPTWTVVEGSAPCPIGPNTIVVGAPTGCPLPGPDGPWISIRPLPADLAELGDFAATCGGSSINDAPACRALGATERLAFDGTEAFLEISFGTGGVSLGDITNTIRTTTVPPPSPGALDLARAWVTASYAHECDTLFDLASTELRADRSRERFAVDCASTLPSGTVTIDRLHSPVGSGSRAVVLVEATAGDGSVVSYRFEMGNTFDVASRMTRWSVLSVDPA